MFEFIKPEYTFSFWNNEKITMDQLESSYFEFKKLEAGLTRLGLLPLFENDNEEFTSLMRFAPNGKIFAFAAKSYYDFMYDYSTANSRVNLANLPSAVTPIRFSLINGTTNDLPFVFISTLTDQVERQGKGVISFTNNRGQTKIFDSVNSLSVEDGLDVLEVLVSAVGEHLLLPNGVNPTPSKVIRFLVFKQFLRSDLASPYISRGGRRTGSDFSNLRAPVRDRVFQMVEEEINVFSGCYSLSHDYYVTAREQDKTLGREDFSMEMSALQELSNLPRSFTKALLFT